MFERRLAGGAKAHRRILTARRQTVSNWLAGGPCAYEREVRALMTLADLDNLTAP